MRFCESDVRNPTGRRAQPAADTVGNALGDGVIVERDEGIAGSDLVTEQTGEGRIFANTSGRLVAALDIDREKSFLDLTAVEAVARAQ